MFSRPFWDLGFRPFFLLAAAYAVVVVPLWVFILWGHLPLSNYLRGYDLHIHEMLFGFVAAVVTGFLLTAVRNWTKRATLSGGGLAALVLLWIAGRICIWSAALLPAPLVAAVDLAFIPTVAFTIARPIFAARDRRNYGILLVLVALTAANLWMHGKALGLGLPKADVGIWVALDLVVVLLAIIGGRVVPNFTANAVPGLQVRRSPLADTLAVPCLLVLVLVDMLGGSRPWIAAAALSAGLIHAYRIVGWGGIRTLGNPLLWILHVAYLWIPVGLCLRGISALEPALHRSAAVHALTAGAITTFIIAMISRVPLGHTGRPLRAHRLTVVAYALVTLTALIRVIVTALGVDWYMHSLTVAAVGFAGAFAIYLVVYVPILFGARPDGERDWRQPP